jgi:hypothetical protein
MVYVYGKREKKRESIICVKNAIRHIRGWLLKNMSAYLNAKKKFMLIV